uniref:Uncharacterized protein n=1 Tax=Oryza rufipogon TaxID=4529 RepID=A0A0E0N9H0_ORYRU
MGKLDKNPGRQVGYESRPKGQQLMKPRLVSSESYRVCFSMRKQSTNDVGSKHMLEMRLR